MSLLEVEMQEDKQSQEGGRWCDWFERCEVHVAAGDFQELVRNLVLQPRRENQTEDRSWEVGWGYLSDRNSQNWTWENINTQVREDRNEENRDAGENLEEKALKSRVGNHRGSFTQQNLELHRNSAVSDRGEESWINTWVNQLAQRGLDGALRDVKGCVHKKNPAGGSVLQGLSAFLFQYEW